MAFDKVVDSGKLNTAMTSTANAIRAKTGDSAVIPWDESKGFADAVAAITVKSADGKKSEPLMLRQKQRQNGSLVPVLGC